MLDSLLKNNFIAAFKRAQTLGYGTILNSGIIKQCSYRINDIKIAQTRRSAIGIASSKKNDQDEKSSHRHPTSKCIKEKVCLLLSSC